MAQRKSPNPNTPYGRGRILEEKFIQEEQWRRQHPEEAKAKDNLYAIVGMIVVIVIIVLYIVVKSGNNDHYGPRGGHFKTNSHGNKEYFKDKK
jgi:hypothetical protein